MLLLLRLSWLESEHMRPTLLAALILFFFISVGPTVQFNSVHRFAASSLLAGPPTPQGSVSLDQLSWISGCWEGQTGNRVYTEQWMKPAGGLMMGMSRTVAGDKATEYEFLQIRQQGQNILYVAKPSGQTEASFTLVRHSDREAVFENPQHDFPQRIIYRVQADGALLARIEGKNNGTDRAVDYPMKRAICP